MNTTNTRKALNLMMALALIASSMVAFAGMAAAQSDEITEWEVTAEFADGEPTIDSGVDEYEVQFGAFGVGPDESDTLFYYAVGEYVVDYTGAATVVVPVEYEDSIEVDSYYITEGDGTPEEMWSVDPYTDDGRTIETQNGDTVELSITALDANGDEIELTHDVTVTVTDPDDEPVANETVQLGSNEATTNDEGVATFESIEEGTWELFADIDGYVEHSEDVTVDSENTTFDVEMTAVHTVDFEVFESLGAPVEDATVTIGDETAVTDSAGYAEVDGIGAGDYTVTVEHADFDTIEGDITVDRDLTVAADFDTGIVDVSIFGGGGGLLPGSSYAIPVAMGALAIILATLVLGVFAKVAGD